MYLLYQVSKDAAPVARVQIPNRRHFLCGLSSLLVFSPGTLVSPSPKKPTLPNFNSIWDTRTHLSASWLIPFFVQFTSNSKSDKVR